MTCERATCVGGGTNSARKGAFKAKKESCWVEPSALTPIDVPIALNTSRDGLDDRDDRDDGDDLAPLANSTAGTAASCANDALLW